nr:DUF2510 domain-containing protein [Mycobacterium sp. IS-1742]
MRWWNGSRWTENVRRNPPPAPKSTTHPPEQIRVTRVEPRPHSATAQAHGGSQRPGGWLRTASRVTTPARKRQNGTPNGGYQSGREPDNPLNLPHESVDMPWRGKGAGVSSSELGFARDHRMFWRVWRDKYKSMGALSKKNLRRIEAGKSPIVDRAWISKYPQHKGFKGQTLDHHHVGQGGATVPVPRGLHQKHSVLHPARQVVATPKGQVNPLNPPQTRAENSANVARHFPGRKPPNIGKIPPNSPIAAEQNPVPVPPTPSPVSGLRSAKIAPARTGSSPAIAKLRPRGGGTGFLRAVGRTAGVLSVVTQTVDVYKMWKHGAWETPVGTLVHDERKYTRHVFETCYGENIDNYEGKVVDDGSGVKFLVRDGLIYEWDDKAQKARDRTPLRRDGEPWRERPEA